MKKQIQFLALLVLTVLILSGCGAEPAGETEAVTTAATAPPVLETTEAVETTEESIANGMEFAPTETFGDAVQTPYITLYCPVDWQDLVRMEPREENDAFFVTFHTAIADADTELFTLVFSPTKQEGNFFLGTLEEQGEVIYITALMNQTRPETWSQEDSDQFNALQERINDLILQLYEDPRFVPGKK